MQLYTCTVRLNGSMLNEVQKTDVTAAEIRVLKAIHSGPETGIEVITNIKATGRVDRDDDAERERLRSTYGEALSKKEHGPKTVEAMIGWDGTPLPQSVPGVDSLPAPKAGRRAAKVEQPEPEIPPEQVEEPEFI